MITLWASLALAWLSGWAFARRHDGAPRRGAR